MMQGYLLCALNYDFHILNEAFLIHKPGIKKVARSQEKEQRLPHCRSKYPIRKEIIPQMKKLLYPSDECLIKTSNKDIESWAKHLHFAFPSIFQLFLPPSVDYFSPFSECKYLSPTL